MNTMRSLSKTITQQDTDASRHTLICGESGTGMSVYLMHLMHQNIVKGKKILLIDAWGSIAKEISQIGGDKAVIVDLSDASAKGLCDIFQANSPQDYDRVAQNVIDLFVQIYDPNRTGVVGPRFEFAVRNIVITLLYAEMPSFLNMHKAMIDVGFLQSLLPRVPEGPVRQYVTDYIARSSDSQKTEILDYVVSKFGIFMQENPVKYIFEKNDKKQDLVSRVKSNQIVIINTASIRTDSAIAHIVHTALGGKVLELTQTDLGPKSVYIEEINLFGGSHDILHAFETGRQSETEFTVVSRDLENMPALLRSKILRFGTIAAFRQAVKDGQVLAEYFLDPTVTAQSLATQKRYSFSLKYFDGGEIKSSMNNGIDFVEKRIS